MKRRCRRRRRRSWRGSKRRKVCRDRSSADILRGDDADAAAIARLSGCVTGSVLTNIDLIDGLQDFLDCVDGRR